jgi:O-antigen/teichoic acid export membrane protein
VLGKPAAGSRAPRGHRQVGLVERTAERRGESPDQVLDRNLAELLQELRVAFTGVQLLFAFLLTLPFQARFDSLDDVGLVVYTVTLLSTALATLTLIAPVSFHRLVFRRQQKAALVAVADRLLLTGLALLLLAITSATLLVLDVALGRPSAVVGAVVVAGFGVVLWYVLPVRQRRRGLGTEPAGDDGPRP